MSSGNVSFFNNKNQAKKSGDKDVSTGAKTSKPANKKIVRKNSFFSAIGSILKKEPDRSGVIEESVSGSNRGKSSGGEDFFMKALLYIVGTILLSGFLFCAVFLFSVRGAEKITVPSIVGSTLAEAQIALQERGLYMELHMRYTSNPKDRGLVVSQGVEANTVTKVGRIVPIFVSMGTSVTKVGDYLGRDLDDVLMEIDSFALYQEALMQVQKPIIYRYDDTPEGTILEQSPDAGTPISQLTEISLVVSRGSQDYPIETPQLIGLNYKEAILKVAKTNHTFIFNEGSPGSNGNGSIVDQSPAAGADLDPMAPVTLTVAPPARVPKGYKWGIMNYSLPVYEAPVDIRVMAIDEKEIGEPRLIFGIRHLGGDLSFPYLEPKGTIIMIYAYDKELHRFEVSSN